jgi:hypothetical protein
MEIAGFVMNWYLCIVALLSMMVYRFVFEFHIY